MATRPAPTDALRDITAQVVADNPDIADRAKRIISSLLIDVERTIRAGDPREKAVYVKAILPGLLRAMQDNERDDDQSLQEAFTRVMAAVKGG